MLRAQLWISLVVGTISPNFSISAKVTSASTVFEYYGRDVNTLTRSSILYRSNFDPKPESNILFYIHGYLIKNLGDGENGSGSRKMKDAIFEKRNDVDYVVLVDWTRYSDVEWNDYYKTIWNDVPTVATSVSKEIERLLNTFPVQSSNIIIMAHSLGSHIAGQAGRILKMKGYEVGLILALDPSRTSVFSNHQPEYLDKYDAKVVITIHTDELIGMYRDIGKPENNIYVKSGPSYEKCNSDHACQHGAAKGSVAEALENPGPLNQPATYEKLNKPRTEIERKLKVSSDTDFGILKLGSQVNSTEHDSNSIVIAALTFLIFFGIFSSIYLVYRMRCYSEVICTR